MLVLGIMLSTTGVGLAISGLASSGSAGKAQYGNPGGPPPVKPCKHPPCGHQTQLGSSGETSRGGGQASTVNASGQTKATAGGSSLPFTGLLAIPLILAGGALLITGIGLRRRTA